MKVRSTGRFATSRGGGGPSNVCRERPCQRRDARALDDLRHFAHAVKFLFRGNGSCFDDIHAEPIELGCPIWISHGRPCSIPAIVRRP